MAGRSEHGEQSQEASVGTDASAGGDGSIRVLIVGHQPLFRRGLAACLATDTEIDVVATASTTGEGYRLADEYLPDVALVGTTLPDALGLTAAAELRRRFPVVAVVVVAAQETDDELLAAIRAGAAAYCGVDVAEEELVRLVRRAAAGEYAINDQVLSNPRLAPKILELFRTTPSDLAPASAFAPLTDRELEILRKVSDGMTNAEIGYALGISPQTVKNHVTSIMRKLTVNDRTQAVVKALREGLLTLKDE